MKYKVLKRGNEYAIKTKDWFTWRWETTPDGFVKKFASDYAAVEYVFNKYKPLKHDRWLTVIDNADL